MIEKQSVSIYRLIYRRFIRQSLIPFLLIFTLIVALFLLNNYQSTTNRSALQGVAKSSFEEIANQTASVINQRFAYDKLRLYQLRDTFELILSKKAAYALDSSRFKEYGGFFIYRDANASNPFETTVYSTNLLELHNDDRLYLSALQTLSDSIARAVDEDDDLITAAWVNIGKTYALAYPPIVPTDELSPELDVTEYSFYYQADPEHNPRRDIVYLPLYKEPWAVDAGELGAFLIPIYHQERFIGVIGLTLSATGIADVITKLSLPFDAYAQLVDDEGHLIVTSDETRSFSDYAHHSFYALHKNPDLPDRSLMKIDTRNVPAQRTHYERPIEGTGMIMSIQADNAQIFKTIAMLTQQTLIVGIVLAVVMSIIYIVVLTLGIRRIRSLAQQLSSTLERMVRFSSRLGRQEGLSLEPSAIDELDTLGTHLKATHQKLLDLLIKDEQTGLFNRRKLLEDIGTDEALSLMLFRIRNYKSLYNLYGDQATDILISGIVEYLKLDAKIAPYRISDDEFALLYKGDGSEHFETLHQQLQIQTFKYGPITIHPLLFSGFALHAPLYEMANLSLLSAQQQNAHHAVSCQEAEEVKALFEANLEWSNKLNLALKENRLIPYFQPIYDIKKGTVTKFESLVRMRLDDAIIPPIRFLDAAANMGKTHEITKVMVQKVFAIAARYPELSFNINVSFRDFLAFDLLHYIDETQHAYGINTQHITFELLETDAIEDVDTIIRAITGLKTRGYHIAIDDFGTGHSNFAHLMMMRFDYIKIDGQFIKEVNKDPNSATIARTIAKFSALMGAKSVAEYVADEQILKRVSAFEIDYAQGYAISPPVPADGIAAIVAKYHHD